MGSLLLLLLLPRRLLRLPRERLRCGALAKEPPLGAPHPLLLAGRPCSSDSAAFQERTLIALKPDGVQRRLLGDVIKRFERRGFKLVGLKLLQANEGILAEHYQQLQKKPFYQELIQYMSSGPVVAMVWEGHNVVKASRAMVGETNPVEAKPGTLRGDFSAHVSRNVVHASDSVETAQREIGLWFQSNELVSWDCWDHKLMYEP